MDYKVDPNCMDVWVSAEPVKGRWASELSKMHPCEIVDWPAPIHCTTSRVSPRSVGVRWGGAEQNTYTPFSMVTSGAGCRYPNELYGCIWLYSRLHLSTSTFASLSMLMIFSAVNRFPGMCASPVNIVTVPLSLWKWIRFWGAGRSCYYIRRFLYAHLTKYKASPCRCSWQLSQCLLWSVKTAPT